MLENTEEPDNLAIAKADDLAITKADCYLLKLSTSQVEHLAEEQHGARCIEARLNTPINPGKASLLEGGVVLTQLQTPFPAAIFQNEPQRVLYEDNVFMLSPYKILKQTTKVRLSSSAWILQ